MELVKRFSLQGWLGFIQDFFFKDGHRWLGFIPSILVKSCVRSYAVLKQGRKSIKAFDGKLSFSL